MSKITVTNRKVPGAKVEAVLYTEEQWDKVKDHVGKAERKAKELAEEMKYKLSRKEISDAMTKKWENTYLNLRKKRFETRRARLEREKNLKYERFLKLQKEEKKLREEIRQVARDRLYEEKDNAKCALTAYKFAEVLRERQKQIKFNRKLREIEEEREQEYVKKIYEDVEQFKKEEEENKIKALETKLKLGKEGVERYLLSEEKKIKDKERRKAEEKEDLALIEKEIQEIDENEHKERERKKKLVRQNIMENRQIVADQKKILIAEENEENEAINIIANAKMRMGKLRKEKEAAMRAAAVEKARKISAAVTALQESKEDKDEEIFQKAQAEKAAIESKRLITENKNKMNLRHERVAAHNDYLHKEEIRKFNEHEILKWDMLQRYKKEELNRQFKNLSDELRRRKALEIRADNIKQIEEAEQKKKEELEIDRFAIKRAEELWQMEDHDFFKFVDMLKKDCDAVGRPVFPLDNVVCDYKKRTGLLELPPQHQIWKSNLPILDKPKKRSKSQPFRIEYTTMGNAKNPMANVTVPTPISFVKNMKQANGLQDFKK